MNRKTICVLVPTYNEEENIGALYKRVTKVFDKQLSKYDMRLLFIDNDSMDRTRSFIRELASKDSRVSAIFNMSNFGYSRSVFYGLQASEGDATVLLNADMQDPPELIPEFITKWEEGYKNVLGIKQTSKETRLIRALRNLYYKIVKKVASTEQIEQFNGFGLYDASFIKAIRRVSDTEPYLKGIVSEYAGNYCRVPYEHQEREFGKASNQTFNAMYDFGMQAITSYSKTLLRLPTFVGALVAVFACLIFIVSFILFIFGDPWIIEHWIGTGILLALGVQLFFTGIVGEYIASIRTRTMSRPIVIESERINF